MIRRLVASLNATLAATAFAGPWVPYNANVEKQNAVSVEGYRRIDFLTPSALPDRQQIQDCLATYDVSPSFAPDRHWCLREKASAYLLDSWESSARTDPDAAEHRTVAFPPDLASLVREVWLNAILEAHYPRFYLAGADGEVHYFGAMRDDSKLLLRAEAFSPQGDLPPRWFAEAGEQIFNHARPDSGDTVQLRKALVALRKRLFSYYETHGRY